MTRINIRTSSKECGDNRKFALNQNNSLKKIMNVETATQNAHSKHQTKIIKNIRYLKPTHTCLEQVKYI